MDYRGINFDWNHARAFLVTAREGSLSAAARALGVSQPTLSRQVRALENELQAALFERGGRGLELTPTGAELLEQVTAMAEAATQFSLKATGHAERAAGQVTISTSDVMAAEHLPSVLQGLHACYPAIRIDIITTTASSDLKRREADIAIRFYRPSDPELIARKVGDLDGRLYAADSYLQAFGEPLTLDNVGRAAFLGAGDQRIQANFLAERGLRIELDQMIINTANHLVHWALLKQGLGIGIMPSVVADPVAGVQRVLTDIRAFDVPIWLVAHRELRTSRRIRVVYDYLAESLSSFYSARAQQS